MSSTQLAIMFLHSNLFSVIEMGVLKRMRTPRSKPSLAQYKMAAASTREAFVASRHTLWLRGALTSRETPTSPINNASELGKTDL
ncbi:hypothetical protein PoB_007658800 [Plakobranchus ocellatus]|uniref:Secreted protein n=1 Tax=Plakobranchus ocellatus TaxID=259542 RepID=A0AAV4E0G7_9GAST|nr:hypothetical protein PoB_007658800 [Plakobranchus ocellatus]